MRLLGAAITWSAVMLSSLAQEASPVDWATLSRLLPEAILVGFFMWFTLRRDAAQAQHDKDVETLRCAAEAKRDQERADRQDAYVTRWQEFLQEEREWRKVSIDRVADELAKNTIALTQLSGQMLQHEASVSERARQNGEQLAKLLQENSR